MGQVKFCDLKPCGVCEKDYSSSDMFNEEMCKFCVENIREEIKVMKKLVNGVKNGKKLSGK